MTGLIVPEVEINQFEGRSSRSKNKYSLDHSDSFGPKKQGSPATSISHGRPSRSRRVSPSGKDAMLRQESEDSSEVVKRKSRRSRPRLKIDTKASPTYDGPSTPATAASTPTTPAGVRGSSDLRRPGARKTPRAAMEKDAIPDFITQTDRFGNPSTPRSEGAIRSARNQGNDKNGNADIDACETLLDSIRLMCCCLVPEDPVIISTKPSPTSPTQVDSQLTQRDDTIKLLHPIHPDDKGKKCLVLDLDETLVHSSFRAVPGADFVIPVQIEDVVHFVYVAKRPGVDEFLVEMAKHYEIVVYTASLNKYADPLLDLLDTQRVVRARLFRESCVYYEGNYVKDLSLLDRDLTQSIIVDNSPNSYIFHPENAIDCTSFIDDLNDRELDQIGSFLTGIRDIKDVRGICPKWRDWPDVDIPEDSESPEYEQ